MQEVYNTMTRKITNRAIQIFGATRYECKKHINAWGYNPETDGGFNSISTETTGSDVINTRLMNDLQALLEKDRKELELSKKYEIITEQQFNEKTLVLLMVEKTINNSKRFCE